MDDDWTETLAHVARAVGCTVDLVDGPARALHVTCPTLQAKTDLLHACAEVSSCDPYVQAFAMALRERWHADAEFVEGLLSWIQTNVTWRDEPGDRFTHAATTLRALSGDCDDTTIVFVAVCLAAGIEAEARACTDETGDGVHAAPAAKLAGEWLWCETTVRAAVGDHPRDVQARLGR